MATTTQKTRTDETIAGPAQNQGSLAVIPPARIPYPEEAAKFNCGPDMWRALIDAIFPSAKTPEGVMLALTYCHVRKLDIFRKPVHVVPIYNSKLRREIESVWPGIGELRITAHRTGAYAGIDEALVGETVARTFKDRIPKGDNRWDDEELTLKFPSWIRMTVYRIVHSQRVPFVGPKVFWESAYGRKRGTAIPNEKWATDPAYMLEKCAEAAALRRAFPEELGEFPTAEEMWGQIVDIEPTPQAETAATGTGTGGAAAKARPTRSTAKTFEIYNAQGVLEGEPLEGGPATDLAVKLIRAAQSIAELDTLRDNNAEAVKAIGKGAISRCASADQERRAELGARKTGAGENGGKAPADGGTAKPANGGGAAAAEPEPLVPAGDDSDAAQRGLDLLAEAKALPDNPRERRTWLDDNWPVVNGLRPKYPRLVAAIETAAKGTLV